MKKNIYTQSGHALVTVLVFMVIAIALITTTTTITINNSRAASSTAQRFRAEQIAESGVENALLRLLRDPSYTGETLLVGDGTATITVSGSNPITITSVGQINDHKQTLQVQITYNENVMTVSSWEFVY